MNILNLVPVFGVVGAVVISGESIRSAQVAGGAVIVAGAALGMVERGPRAAATPDEGGPPDRPRRAEDIVRARSGTEYLYFCGTVIWYQ